MLFSTPATDQVPGQCPQPLATGGPTGGTEGTGGRRGRGQAAATASQPARRSQQRPSSARGPFPSSDTDLCYRPSLSSNIPTSLTRYQRRALVHRYYKRLFLNNSTCPLLASASLSRLYAERFSFSSLLAPKSPAYLNNPPAIEATLRIRVGARGGIVDVSMGSSCRCTLTMASGAQVANAAVRPLAHLRSTSPRFSTWVENWSAAYMVFLGTGSAGSAQTYCRVPC